MKIEVQNYLGKFSDEIKDLFRHLRDLIYKSFDGEIVEELWGNMPTYFAGKNYIRLITFADHININASAVLDYKEQLNDFKITPKGMLQIFLNQTIPEKTLKEIFKDTLQAS